MAWYDSLIGTGASGGFGASPVGTFTSAFIPAALGGVLGYYNQREQNRRADDQLRQQQTFESSQNEYNWQQRFAMAEKEAQAAAEIAAMEAEAAKQALIQKAYSDAMNAILGGGQLRHNAISTFLSGVQAPYLNRSNL